MGVFLVRLLLIADIELLVRVCSMQHSMQQYAAVCTTGFRKLESLASSAHDHAGGTTTLPARAVAKRRNAYPERLSG